MDGRRLCVIAKSTKGPCLEPYYGETNHMVTKSMSNFSTSEDIETLFGSGNLVDIFKEAKDIGVKDIHLIRIDSSNTLDEFEQLKQAYEIANSLDVDIVYPDTINLDDYVYDYKKFNLDKIRKVNKKKISKIKLNYIPKKIKTFKLNDKNIYNYNIEGKYIYLPYEINTKTDIFIEYYFIKEIKLNFEVVVLKNNSIVEKKEITKTFKPTDSNFITENKTSELFDYEYLNASYYIKHNYPFVQLYTKPNGSSRIEAYLRDEEYTKNSVKKINIALELAKISSDFGFISIIKPPQEKNPFNYINNLKRRFEDLTLAHIISPITEGSGVFVNNIEPIIASNIAIRDINNRLTNTEIINLVSIDNNYDSNKCVEAGYLYVGKSIRNGIVIKKAQTLNEGVLNELKNTRIILNLSKILNKRINEQILGKPKTKYNKLQSIYTNTLEEFVEENKIENFHITFKDKKTTHLSVFINKEIDLIKHNIISES